MKKKTFTLFRTTALLFASCFLMGNQVTAQTAQIPLEFSDAALNSADLSGSYVIQCMPSGKYLSPVMGKWGDITPIAFNDPNWVIDLVKVSTGTYYIQYGDKKLNYTHNWLMAFDNTTTTKIIWKITIVSGNSVMIQRNSDLAYVKVQQANSPMLWRLYSNGALSEASTFILKTVTSKKPVNIPQASNFTFVRNPLNAADLSGTYLIQNRAGEFMTNNVATTNDLSVITAIAPNYAITLTKQLDNSYTISSGDLQADYLHPWLLAFDQVTEVNKWTITVVAGDSITIQRVSDNGYLKNEKNPTITGAYKFYSNDIITGTPSISDNVRYALQTVTGVVTGNAILKATEKIKSFVFQNPSTKELKVKNTSKVNTLDIYNVKGQKIYGCKVNTSEVSINTKGWNQGIYLLKLSTTNGGYQNIKTIIN